MAGRELDDTDDAPRLRRGRIAAGTRPPTLAERTESGVVEVMLGGLESPLMIPAPIADGSEEHDAVELPIEGDNDSGSFAAIDAHMLEVGARWFGINHFRP